MAKMSVSDRYTVMETAKRNGYSEDQKRIIEVLQETNQILLDAPVREANSGIIGTERVRSFLKNKARRLYYTETDSDTKCIENSICRLAGNCDVDKSLVDIAADPVQTLYDECVSVLYAMGEDQADDIIYGNTRLNSANINGFAVRRPKLADKYCIDMGGSGNNLTSVYIVKWGTDSAYYMFPKGAKGMGMQRTDKGVVTVENDDGTKYEAYRTSFQIDYGITVKQEGALIRLANIDPEKAGVEERIKQLLKSKRCLWPGPGTIAVYANSGILSMCDAEVMAQNNVVCTAQDPWGSEITTIRDMRLRQMDVICSTESVVTA